MSVFFPGVRVGMPLTGVRVLDFGRYVAGPYAAQMLGFLGAEVIRIERRVGGEDRAMHPIPGSPGGALFAHTCAGKRSLTLEPGHSAAREVVRRLVATADIVVANLPPAGLRALGIDWDSLTAIRPDIILVAANAFGFEGEDADRPGFDGVGQAVSGAIWFSGEPGRPVKAAAPYVDFSSALLAALGALAALMHRQRTGEGQRVEVALARTACAAFGAFLGEEAATGIGRRPTGNRVQTSAPSDLFATRDGHVLIHVVGDGLFRRLARLLGREDWLSDPGLLGDEARGERRDALCAGVAKWMGQRTTAEAMAELERAGVPAGAVGTIAEAAAEARRRGWLLPLGGPHGPAGFSAGLPLVLSAMALAPPEAPPALGADTEAILAELGFTPQEIADLRASGAA